MRYPTLYGISLIATAAIIAGCGDSSGPEVQQSDPGAYTTASTVTTTGRTNDTGHDQGKSNGGNDDTDQRSGDSPNDDGNNGGGDTPNGPATTNGVDFGIAIIPTGPTRPIPISGKGTVLHATNSSFSTPVTVTRVNVTNTDFADFSLKRDGCTGTVLIKNSKCTVTIVYKRRSPGNSPRQRHGTVTFTPGSGTPKYLQLVGADSPPLLPTSKPTIQGGTVAATDPPKVTPFPSGSG